jgi:hypothetical protein
MTSQNLIYLLVAAALIVWIGVRQLTWQNLTQRSVWLMPGLLTVIGLVSLVGTTKPDAITVGGVGILLGEIALSVAIGLTMGAITRFRRVENETVDNRGRRVLWQVRTGWMGLVLWVLLIGVRIGIDVWASRSGFGALVASTGAILLVVGANRLCRSALLQLRMSRHQVALAA